MKRTTLALALIIALSFSAVVETEFVNVAKANPMLPTEIPPVVRVPAIQVNVTISWLNGTLWAKVDATYPMNTIYAFGDKYQALDYSTDPPTEVTVTVTYDKLEAHYPIPLNATNISVKMDGADVDWVPDKRFYHLFDANLPEINWTVSPVPQNFSITAHYEHQVPKTDQTHAYLGKYAFLFPTGSRYGLAGISYAYNEYPWFGNSTGKFGIQIEPTFTNIHAYSIDGFGSLKPLNYTISTENTAERIELIVSGESPTSYETTSPYGIVLVFDDAFETSEPFPTTLIVTVAVIVVVVGLSLWVYFKRRNHAKITNTMK